MSKEKEATSRGVEEQPTMMATAALTTKEEEEDSDGKSEKETSSVASAVVIDMGSLSVRAGFAADNCPRIVFPTIDPVWQRQNNTNKEEVEDDGGGDDEKNQVQHPIERGYITTQWESMEDVWHHTFYNELHVKPESQPVLITEPPLNPKASRERTVQILFNTFNVPALYLYETPVLALFATGRTTGCVVDSGHGVTHIVPIYEGYAAPHATKRIDIAGRDVTEYLAQTVLSKQEPTPNTDRNEMARVVKESGVCYVAMDFSAEMEKPDYELVAKQPVGVPITNLEIGKEAFRCTEILFQPNIIVSSDERLGVVQATYQSMIDACGRNNEYEIFHLLCANIVLTGGNTLFPGFSERFTNDMKELMATKDPSRRLQVKVIAPETRKFDVWRGGSTIASLTMMENMWITQEEYRSDGINCIYRKLQR